MLQSLLAVMFLAVLAGAGSAQQSPKIESQVGHANPCGTATTQADMNQCSAGEYKKADAQLNAVYKNLIRSLQKDTGDAQQQTGGERRKPEAAAVQGLKAAQRLWIRYRDLHCGAVRAQYEGGSIAAMQWSACMTETTNHRIEELQHGYETGDRKLD